MIGDKKRVQKNVDDFMNTMNLIENKRVSKIESFNDSINKKLVKDENKLKFYSELYVTSIFIKPKVEEVPETPEPKVTT